VEKLHNDTQRALADTVNDLLAEGLRGDDALERIVEDIQPAVLFHPHVRPNAKLYRYIRDIFVFIGVAVERRRSYPVIRALANAYPEGEFRNDALFQIDDSRVNSQRTISTTSTPNSDSNN
jgi:hypothetical protein